MRGFLGVFAAAGSVIAGGASAQLATFDEHEEGFVGFEFTSGGITFFEPVHFFGEAAPFAVENVANVLPDKFPLLEEHFSSPNVLGLAGFVSGPDGWLMGRIEQIKMTTGKVESYARMDVFYDDAPFFGDTEVILEAILDGQIVATDSFIIEGLDAKTRKWNELEISGVAFDVLRLTASGGQGGPDDNGFLASLDNVQIIPAPWAAAAVVGGLGLVRRRRE